MNDELESQLSALKVRPLPPEWRAQILGHLPQPRVPETRRAPPRWLMAGWGLAWAAVIALHFSTPAAPRSNERTPPAISVNALQQRAELMQSLLAFN
jgi:hypothetical protein